MQNMKNGSGLSANVVFLPEQRNKRKWLCFQSETNDKSKNAPENRGETIDHKANTRGAHILCESRGLHVGGYDYRYQYNYKPKQAM